MKCSILTSANLSEMGRPGRLIGDICDIRRSTPGAFNELTHLRRDPERIVIALLQMNDMIRPIRQMERHVIIVVGIRDCRDAEVVGEGINGPFHLVHQGAVDGKPVPNREVTGQVFGLALEDDLSSRWRSERQQWANGDGHWINAKRACRNVSQGIGLGLIGEQDVSRDRQYHLVHLPAGARCAARYPCPRWR